MIKRERIKAELEHIRKENHGVLTAGKVVAFAKKKGTALHSQFDWDNASAGHKYRLWQARKVIAVHVEVIHEDVAPIKAYIHLRTENRDGGGYRTIQDVMTTKSWRDQLLLQAHQDMATFREKYVMIKELEPVFDAMKKVRKPRLSRTGAKKATTKRKRA